MITLVNQTYINELDKVIAEQYYLSFIRKHGKTRFVRYKRFKSKIVNTDKDFSYTITIPQYTTYSNDGRAAGKEPPLGPLIDWVRFKFGLGNSKKAVGIAWAIKKKIGKRGIPYKGTTDEPKAFAQAKINEVKEQIVINIKKRFLQYATKKTIVIKL